MKSKISIFLTLYFLLVFVLPVNAQEEQEYPVYIIQSGDTLGQIALLFNTTTDEIISLNSISNPNSIYPGLQLKIPGMGGVSGIITPVIIDFGESWQNILVKYEADETTVIQINNLLNLSSLYAGYRLLMPVKSESKIFTPKSVIDDDSLLLEKSVLLNSNPVNLLIQNCKKSDLSFFENDVIYTNNPDQPSVSHFSSAIETLTISPLPLAQGETISVQVSTFQPLILSGQINGHVLNFYTSDNHIYYALQGIHAMAEPGVTDFSLTGTSDSGEVFSISQPLLLRSGNFETDPPLTVSPDLIDPAITEPEMDKITSLIKVFTSQRYWAGEWISPDRDYATVIPNYEARKEITSYFGSRRTYNDDPNVTFHTGVDFGGGTSLPIVAPAAGKVVFAGFLDIRGNATVIDHGLGVFSAYYHQSKLDVAEGDMIEKGQKIGEVGNTGRVDRSDEYEGAGAHLHWEIWVNGVQVNPLDWLYSEYPR